MNKHLVFRIVTVWFLITQTFPPYDYFVHIAGVLNLGAFSLLAIVLFPNLLVKKSIIALFLYTFAVFMVFLGGNAYYDSIAQVIVPSATMLSALLITEYALKYDVDYKYTKIVLLTVLVTNIIMIIISIPQLIINSNIIRGASTFAAVEGETMVYYWIISYETIHGLPLLFAPLVFLCRKTYSFNKKRMLLYSIVVTLLFYIVFESNATMALMISLVMILLGLFFDIKKFNPQTLLKLSFWVIMMVLLLSPRVMVPVLKASQDLFDPTSSNYNKIGELEDRFTYGDSGGDLGLRQDLYNQSKELFFAEPLTGTSRPDLISRHTWIWDQLACLGIILFLTFIILFVIHVRRVYMTLALSKSMYLWSIVGLFFLLYLKNSFGPGTWLYGFALLPILCRYVEYVIKTK